MLVSKPSPQTAFDGNNGLLYTNQWFNGSTSQPYYRVVWATDFAVTNAKLVLQADDSWTFGADGQGYSTDPAKILQQIEIRSGASRFRNFDWSVYTLGQQNNPPYLSADGSYSTTCVQGPHTGVNSAYSKVNPSPTPAVTPTPAPSVGPTPEPSVAPTPTVTTATPSVTAEATPPRKTIGLPKAGR